MLLSASYAAHFATNEKFRNRIIKTHVESYYEERPNFDEWVRLTQDSTPEDYFLEARYLIEGGVEDTQVFLVRQTAQDIAKKINIKEEKKFDYLKRIPDGDYMFIISNDEFIKFFKIESRLVILACQRNSGEHYCMFNFMLSNGYEQIGDDAMSHKYAQLFFQLCIFWQFAKPEVVVLPAGRKLGTRREGKVTNNAPFAVTILDKMWNKMVIRNEEFDVSGHLRLQPCGKGNLDRELIWIDDFKKKGYVRGFMKKEMVDNETPAATP